VKFRKLGSGGGGIISRIGLKKALKRVEETGWPRWKKVHREVSDQLYTCQNSMEKAKRRGKVEKIFL